MELTQKQEQYIARYIYAVSESIAGKLTTEQRDRALTRLRGRVENQLESLQKRIVDDVDVLDVLRGMGAPERQATILVRVWGGEKEQKQERLTQGAATSPINNRSDDAPVEKEESAGITQGVEQKRDKSEATFREREMTKGGGAVWLGVCAYYGKIFDLPVWVLRVFITLLGIAMAPVVIVLYMGVYLRLRAVGRVPSEQPLRITRIVLRPIGFTLSIIGIFVIGKYAIKAITAGYEIWLEKMTPDIADWAWLESTDERMLLLMLLFLVPISLLSAMPLPDGWDYSLKRLSQACIALYAIVTSFGIASYISGIIIHFVRDFTG